MNEKKQENVFQERIEPLIEELSSLCEEFGMAMVASVQLYTNDETGARTATQVIHPKLMSAAMAMSTSLLNGGVEIKVANGVPELVFNLDEFPEELEPYTFEAADDDWPFSNIENGEIESNDGFSVLATRKGIIH